MVARSEPPAGASLAPLCVDVVAAAAALGVGESVVRGWVERGLLPTVRFPSLRRPGESSRRIVIAVEDLRDFVARHREDSRG